MAGTTRGCGVLGMLTGTVGRSCSPSSPASSFSSERKISGEIKGDCGACIFKDTRALIFANWLNSSATRAKPVTSQSRLLLLSLVLQIPSEAPLLTKPSHTVCALHAFSPVVTLGASSLFFLKHIRLAFLGALCL